MFVVYTVLSKCGGQKVKARASREGDDVVNLMINYIRNLLLVLTMLRLHRDSVTVFLLFASDIMHAIEQNIISVQSQNY